MSEGKDDLAWDRLPWPERLALELLQAEAEKYIEGTHRNNFRETNRPDTAQGAGPAMRGQRWAWGLLALAGPAGCRPAPPVAPDTGARAAVRTYYEALVRQDWPAAHAALGPASRASDDAARFAERARAWRRGLGFEPEAVYVRSCDEQGDGAVAHIVLAGRGGARTRYKDAATLRRGAAGWGVVLLPSFGRAHNGPGR
jgi:hypothetical protein